jgi:hypothetical protein
MATYTQAEKDFLANLMAGFEDEDEDEDGEEEE